VAVPAPRASALRWTGPSSLRFADAYVGGLDNAAWDLVFNTFGSLMAAICCALYGVDRIMETTLEVRWFAPGHPPDALTRRFDDLGAPGPQSRTDTYLDLSGTDDLGVKLREGGKAFELKLRQHDFGETKLAGRATGNLERWQKWSYPVIDAACQAAGLGLPGGSWVEVEKNRRLITYRLAADGTVVPVEARQGDGCSVEITTLVMKGSEWWSLGFEAFGAHERLADALTATAETFFAGADVDRALDRTRSCGYPAWLQS
jgi:hypothetical protein